MVIIRSGTQWMLAIALMIIIVVFAEWLEYHFHTLSNLSKEQIQQIEINRSKHSK